MTRDEFEYVIGQAKETASEWVVDKLNEIEQHDAAQREEIAKLRDTRDSLATQLNEYVQEVAQKDEEITSLRSSCHSFDLQVRELQADLIANEKEIARLNESYDADMLAWVGKIEQLHADLDRVKAERDECDRILTVNYGYGYRDYDAYWKPTTELGKMCALTVKQLAGSWESACHGAGILLKKNAQLHADLATKEEEIRKLRLDLEHFEQLQADLDQVLGEAVWFADVMKTTGNKRAKEFLTIPLVHAYRARQGKEGE